MTKKSLTFIIAALKAEKFQKPKCGLYFETPCIIRPGSEVLLFSALTPWILNILCITVYRAFWKKEVNRNSKIWQKYLRTRTSIIQVFKWKINLESYLGKTPSFWHCSFKFKIEYFCWLAIKWVTDNTLDMFLVNSGFSRKNIVYFCL